MMADKVLVRLTAEGEELFEKIFPLTSPIWKSVLPTSRARNSMYSTLNYVGFATHLNKRDFKGSSERSRKLGFAVLFLDRLDQVLALDTQPHGDGGGNEHR